MTAILEWALGWVLKYLADLAMKEVKDAATQLARDKAEGKINDANVKAYDEAQDRASRRKAALDLLNRNANP